MGLLPCFLALLLTIHVRLSHQQNTSSNTTAVGNTTTVGNTHHDKLTDGQGVQFAASGLDNLVAGRCSSADQIHFSSFDLFRVVCTEFEGGEWIALGLSTTTAEAIHCAFTKFGSEYLRNYLFLLFKEMKQCDMACVPGSIMDSDRKTMANFILDHYVMFNDYRVEFLDRKVPSYMRVSTNRSSRKYDDSFKIYPESDPPEGLDQCKLS